MKVRKLILIALTWLLAGSCSKNKDSNEMSPIDTVNLFQQARAKGDIDLINEIMYFSPDATEEQKLKRVRAVVAGSDERLIMDFVRTKEKAEYEKLIDDETAEVGLVLAGVSGKLKRVPTGQIILKKHSGKWKYYYNKYELSEQQLIQTLKGGTNDASLYYLLGKWIVNENPAKAYCFFKKYYDLEPNGFWVCESFLDELDALANPDKFRIKLLADLRDIPEFSPDRALNYRFIGQMYMENKNYAKAQEYFDKADQILKVDKDPSEIESLKAAKNELKLRLEGKYIDLLSEIEKSQQN